MNPDSIVADPTIAFRGFFIQARLVADDSNVGGFLDPLAGQEYRLSSCVPSTVRTCENYCEVEVVRLLELARLGGKLCDYRGHLQ